MADNSSKSFEQIKLGELYACSAGYNNNDYMIACKLSQSLNRELYAGEYLSEISNTPGHGCMALRIDFDDEARFIQENTATNSMLILNEWPTAILEYMPDKLILSLDPADILLVDKW